MNPDYGIFNVLYLSKKRTSIGVDSMRINNDYLNILMDNSPYDGFYINLGCCDDSKRFEIAEYLSNNGYKWRNGYPLDNRAYFNTMIFGAWRYLIVNKKTKRVLRSTFSHGKLMEYY